MALIITYPKRDKGPSITCFKDIKRIAPRMGLTDNTMTMLVERGFGSVQNLRTMSDSNVEDLPLYAGQQLAIAKLIAHLNEVLDGYEVFDAEPNLGTSSGDGIGGERLAGNIKQMGEKKSEDTQNDSGGGSTMLGDREKAGILNDDGYSSEHAQVGARTVPRPHEFMVGKSRGSELTMEEFLYGNLLIMEYMMEQNSAEVRAYMKHLRFMVLKLVHGYPLEQIVYYDYALRTKIEREQVLMPLTADQELLDKYLRLHKAQDVGEAKKNKKAAVSKSGKNVKGKKKKKSRKAEEEVIGL